MEIPATQPEQIEQIENLEISYRTLHPSVTIVDDVNKKNIIVPFSSITNKYKDFLSTIIIEIPLNEEEQDYYKFKPKLLSDDLYDTTELWNDILILNNSYSIIDFKPKVVKVYDPKRFKSYLNEVMILEEV